MSSIYTRTNALGQILKRELSREFMIVKYPDHPLLIRGPDLLVATLRSITAIFVPLAAERRSFDSLKSRLTLSRLAFPPHTRCILVMGPNDLALGHSLANDFAKILEWSNRAEIVRIISDINFVGRHRDVPPSIIGDAQKRFANAMTVMRIAARLTRRPFSAAFDEEGVRQQDTSISSAIRRPFRRPVIHREPSSVGLDGVPFTELTDTEVDTALVRELVNEQVDYVYSLDNGIPYPRDEPPGVAMVQDWPTRARDSEKLILAAAFGGWAFVLEETRDELPRFARRLRQGVSS